MNTKKVSDAVVRRLPRYYHELKLLEQVGIHRISSMALGERMGLTASQIRQDFNHFGEFGQQGFGYKVVELKDRIGGILGLGKTFKLVILGAGNIGRALAGSKSFGNEGFDIIAMFDVDPSVVGETISGIPVYHIRDFEYFASHHVIDVAAITVPAEAVGELVPVLTKSKIRGIWNFAPQHLTVPGAMIENIQLTDSLLSLVFRMEEKTNTDGGQR